MKNDVDFMKIIVDDKLLGVLNFNNMIPVCETCISPVDLKISEKDNPQAKKYKKMAAKQLNWCQRNQEDIVKRANKLYRMLISGKAGGLLKRRCCNFEKLELVLENWIKKN